MIVSILNLIMLIVPFIILCYCIKILEEIREIKNKMICLLYTSDAADEL